MRREIREFFGEELVNYFELLRVKFVFVEELYGVKMNYVFLIIEGEVVVFDKNDGEVKWFRDKRFFMMEEFLRLFLKIKENFESGFVEMFLVMNMGCINGLGE